MRRDRSRLPDDLARRQRPGAGLGAVLLAALAFGGCAVPFERPPGERPPPATARATVPPPATSAPASSAALPQAGAAQTARPASQAAAALLDQSRTESAAGDYGAAAATVERALALDPNSALLWLELAEIRRSQRDLEQADSLARKALTLAGADRAITERAQRLLQRR